MCLSSMPAAYGQDREIWRVESHMLTAHLGHDVKGIHLIGCRIRQFQRITRVPLPVGS